jgi:hypothetical protein
MELIFASKAPKEHREAVEQLFFFNPQQSRMREGIINSLEKFGLPRLEVNEDFLSVKVADVEAQTLFVFKRNKAKSTPIGVVVFLRTSREEIGILHIAVDEQHSLHGSRSGLGLGVVLMEKVREIAARIVGVERIVFFYRREAVIKV